jgi:hypothetical protein
LAFEAIDTSGQTLTKNVTKLLDIYKQMKKIIAYVKDEGFNLNTIATTLKSIVNCDLLNLKENFQRTCFGHVFLKGVKMQQHRKKFTKAYDMYLSKLPKEICKSA